MTNNIGHIIYYTYMYDCEEIVERNRDRETDSQLNFDK